MVKSFYDPAWMDLGVLGFYGRWIDVNWVWVEWLTIYHAVFSIAIPIILVESAFPDKRNRPWLSNRMLGGITALLGGVTVFGYLFLTPYRPPIPQYLFSILLVFALTLTAQRISNKAGKHGIKNPLSPLKTAFFGFIIALALFMFFGAGPSIIGQPGLLMLLGFGLVITFYSLLRRYSWGERTLYQKFSLAAGALGFLIFLTPIQEFDSSRADNPRGMLLIGTAAAIMLLLLRRKLKSSISSLEVNMYCVNCGRVLPANAIFCPDCGIEVETH
jgi:hypothetical protein